MAMVKCALICDVRDWNPALTASRDVYLVTGLRGAGKDGDGGYGVMGT